MSQFIEIVSMATNEVVKQMDVTGKSQREIDRIERGVLINLNTEEYFTQVSDSVQTEGE